MSLIVRTTSNIFLPLTYAHCSSLINSGSTFSSLIAMAFDAILVSTFSNDHIGLQLVMCLLSLFFLSISLIIPTIGQKVL